ncbi:putative FYVE zinc finger, Zinc finger, FYVE/PHD-type, Zinc finger, RING/FYVE/PHD-type [Plasmopara halstedii]
MPFLENTASIDAFTRDFAKSHRLRFRNIERSTATDPSLSCSTMSSACKTQVWLDDDELCARADLGARVLDFNGLENSNESDCKWILHHKSPESFTTHTRRLDEKTTRWKDVLGRSRSSQQVLVTGNIHCHMQEVIHVLNSSNTFDYNAAMRSLYRKDFIYGSVVRIVPPGPGEDDKRLIELLHEKESTMTRVAVKTGTFVHCKRFSPNEQWCFLERAQHTTSSRKTSSKPSSFTLTLSSLDEEEVEAGKVNGHARVKTLHNLNAGYLIEQAPDSPYVQVTFFGQFASDDLNNPRHARASQARARLMRLAEGVTRLPEIVRRRRFGAQTMADHAAFEAKNTHCTCCTKSLRVLTRKHRCHLCGHFVCDRCWSIQEMESYDALHVTPVRVCLRCVEFVDKADYTAVKPSSLRNLQVQQDPIGHPPSTVSLVDLLQSELRTSSDVRKNSVRSVIQYLIDEEPGEHQKIEERPLNHLTSDSTDHEYIDALEKGLSIHQVPLYECTLANASKREYAITWPQTTGHATAPDVSMPSNEEERLAAIARSQILDVDHASELDTLCKLAASQLDCSIGIVTAVTADETCILGSSKDELRRVNLPREHTFCKHTIMSSKPLLVPHPEADVRFQNLKARIDLDVRFYCGFPIVDADDIAIGSLCCLDQKTHEMTQSQYSLMKKLVATAGFMLQSKNQEKN